MAINQVHLFLIFIINGIFIGLIFDFFRILRKGFKTSDFVTYIEDIIFWVISGLSIIYSMVNFSNGNLRFYMVMGILIGFITYILTVGKYIRNFSVAIIYFCKKIFRFMWKVSSYPLNILYKIIVSPLTNIFKLIYSNIKKTNFSTQNKKIRFKMLSNNRNKLKKSVKKRGTFRKNVEK